MSGVRKKDQSEHRFTILDIILDMYEHTTTVTANPKFDTVISITSVRYGNSHNLIYRLNRWYESLWKGRDDEER